MNIKEKIFEFLESENCSLFVNEEEGIVEVYTPEGRVWDFTVPTDITESYNVPSNS